MDLRYPLYGGVGLKTLFVYCSDDEAVNSLCRESAFKRRDAQAIQLTSFSGKSLVSRYFGPSRNKKDICTKDYGVSINDFDRIIIACDEFVGEISPEVSAFISSYDFRYKHIDCIVFGEGRCARRAKDSLKMKLSLSGGTVRNCVNVSAKELKREEEDLLFSVRHRMVV